MVDLSEDILRKTEPLCRVFGECGGCLYQDIPYTDELKIKENKLRALMKEKLFLSDESFDPITASPQSYHYRNRLDLKLMKLKSGEVMFGFSPEGRKRVVPVDACPIARQEISQFLPTLSREGQAKLTAKYRQANLVIRSGEEEKVFWGGIGRRSLQLAENDYFWTTIEGRKVFYSLDTFFQSNLYILPSLFHKIRALDIWRHQPVLFDLYGGVGLFSVGLSDLCQKIYLIEESFGSLRVARYNQKYHELAHLEVIDGKVETEFLPLLGSLQPNPAPKIALIDPPRCGLSDAAIKTLKGGTALNHLLYLSCHMDTLVRDLNLLKAQWSIQKVMPFDFFPRTKHLETLVLLAPNQNDQKGD